MKKILSLLLIIFAILFTGCSVQNNPLNSEYKESFYYDDLNINVSGIHLELSCSEFINQNANLSISLTATNTQTKDREFNLENIKIIDEETNVAYNCSSSSVVKTLQYNIKTDFYISAVVPISYKTHNYHIQFTVKGKKYLIKLYETPDELRQNHIISFKLYSYPNYIDIDETITVKDNRTCDRFIWEDKKHTNYCDNWYTDEARTTVFNWNTKITNDTILYGVSISNVLTNYDSSGAYIIDIKHVPKDGILVLDNYSENVFIANYGIYNNNFIKEIYLPKKLKKIYFGNFEKMNSLTKIHFAGSEDEWNNIESSSTIPANVSLVFNSTYSV